MKKAMFHSLYDFGKRAENEEKAYDKGFSHTCIVCGKGIKDTAKVKWLRLLDGGEIITESEETVEMEKDMGWYPVGNDCYKRYKQAEI